MIKKIVIVLVSVLLIAGVGILVFSHSPKTQNNVDSAMGTLGNIAETNDKTQDNIKQFNEIFNENEQKPHQ